jgi:hypothetical protein
MAKIRFEDGTIVNFNGTPTPADVDYVAKQLKIKPQNTFAQKVGGDLMNRGKSIAETFKQTAAGKISPAETGIRTVGAVAGGVGDIIDEAITPLLKPVLEPIFKTGAGQAALEAIRGGAEVYNKWKTSSPEATRVAKSLEGVVNIATLLPAYKAGEVGVGAAIKTGETIGKGAATAAKTSGNVLESAGKFAQSTAPMFKPNTKEAAAIIKESAKTTMLQSAKNMVLGKIEQGIRKIADTASSLGLVGLTEKQIAVQAERARKSIWENVVAPALDSVKIKMQKNDLLGDLAKRIESISDPVRRNALRDGLSAVKQDYKHIKEWSAPTIQKLKSELAEFVPDKMYRGKNVAAATTQIRKWMSDEMRKWLYQNIDSSAKTAYLDYGNLKTIIERGQTSLTKAYLEGGAGRLASEVAKRAVTPVATIGGKLLEKAGKALKSIKK